MIMLMIDLDGLFQHFEGPSCNVEGKGLRIATDLSIEVGDMDSSRHKRFQHSGSFTIGGTILTLLVEFMMQLLGKVFDFHFQQ